MWQMQQQQTQQQYLQQPNPRVIRQQQLDLQKWQQQQLQQQHLHQLQQLHQQQLEEDKSKQQRILQQEFQLQLIPQHQLQQQQMQLQQMSQQQLQQQQIQLQRLHQQQAQQQQLQVQQLPRQQQERQPLPLQVPQQQMQQHQRQRRQQPHQQQRLQCQQQPQHEQQYQQQQLQQQQRRQQPQPQQQNQHPQQQQQQRPQQQPQHLQQQSQLQNQQQRPQQQPRHQQQNQQHPQPQPQQQQPRHQQQNQQQHLQQQPQHQQQNQQQQRIIQLNNNDRDQERIYQNGLNNNLNIMETAARPSNPRAARNMAEKQRRDNLNGYIAAMAASVPILAYGDCRKRDKISILRLASAHCRLQYTMGPIDPMFKAPEFMGVDLERTFVNTDPDNPTFVLVLNAAGTIVYISKFIQTYLGHDQHDMLGDSLYNYVYEDDHIDLAKNLSPADCFGHGPSYCSDSLEVADDSREKVDYSLFVDARRHFNIRLAHKATSRREQTQYEYIQLNGLLTLAHKVKRLVRKGQSIKVKTPNDIIFICTARMLRTVTIAELALLDFNKNEYFTRHLVDGRIIFCDHRISVVAGYMCHEVYGTSAFKFMHKEDVRWTIIGLRQMYDQGKHFGSSCYRLINKIGNFIYLRTHGYLEVDEQSRSVCSFICLNTLMSEEEGKALIRDMKDRYSAKTDNLKTKLIRALGNEYRSDSSSRDTDSSSRDYHEDLEDASQLEDAITHLITDLPSQVALDYEHLSPGDTQSNKVAAYSSTLPPAKFQAAAVGITKTFSYRGKGGGKGKNTRGGKNGKGKPDCMRNQEQSTSDNDKSNEEDRKSFPGKKIPELDSPSIPVKTIEEPQVRIAGKDFSMAKACGSQTYSETVRVEDIPPPSKVQIQEIPAGSTIQIQEIPPRSSIRLEKIPNINAIVLEGIPVVSKNKITAHTKPSTSYEARGFMNDGKVTAGQIPNNQSRNNLQQASLKRVHNVNTDNVSKVVFKKRATEDIITLELPKRINGPILTCENGEVLQGCPTFIEVHPMSYNPNMQEPPNYTLDEFQDMPTDTLITTTIDNSPEMMQLLSNIPDMTMEGNSGEPNVQ